MIKQYEVTKTVIEFGHGTVGMLNVKGIHKKTKEITGWLALQETDAHEIGKVFKDHNVTLDNAEVVMVFKNIDGLDALMGQLKRLKKKMKS